jgi:transposase
MYLRRCRRRVAGRDKDYWQLVESYRTVRGPRQRVVAHLGDLDEPGRLGYKEAARGNSERLHQSKLFDETTPRWVEVDTKRLRVERVRSFGGPWLGLQVLQKLDLIAFLEAGLPQGREEIPWAMMGLVLVLSRLGNPSSELRIAEHLYERSALSDLLGVPTEKVNDDRLYRALDALLPRKSALERHLKERLGELFQLEYDLLLYDVTSVYFEGECTQNPEAQRGYSRDHRPDCKQVCVALIVSRGGMPLGYEVFAGNRNDVSTVEEIVESIERKHGAAGRVWAMDRGMASEENVAFLRENGRRYILGTPKSQLRRFERELLEEGWETIRDGLEVKLCPGPEGAETFILCRSAQRREKEKAMHARFEKRIETGLEKTAQACRKCKRKPAVIERRIGRLLGQNSRAAGCFKVEVRDKEGRAQVVWSKVEAWREWSDLSEGCYLLRSNITDWTASELWETYIQLTEAEAAFRIHKSDLSIRPIWHQKPERVQAHILVCFLAYVLWKALGQLCHRAGLGDEPRKVFDEIAQVQLVDVLLPTKSGINLRRRCVAQPTKHQAILLHRLGLTLPMHLEIDDNVVEKTRV